MTAIAVEPPVLRWAQRRSGRGDVEVREKFSRWDQWLANGEVEKFSDIQAVARFTHVPLGLLFLSEPPDEEMPIPDFRTGRERPAHTSDDLLDTIYLQQRRQDWYEDYLSELGCTEPLEFPGSAKNMSVAEAAALITTMLNYSIVNRGQLRGADGARRHLMDAFDAIGGLVVINSMVGNNTHRLLNIGEFRGFTLHSRRAPLVFVNGRDTKNGQVFSLLHEFAHVWRGESGVSAGGAPLENRENESEKWCDSVAAAIAVPQDDLRNVYRAEVDLTEELDRLSLRYCCSTLVILIQLREVGLLPRRDFEPLYSAEQQRLDEFLKKNGSSGGGDFYVNQPFRVGDTLGRAIVRDAETGRTPMTEALRLLAFSKTSTFDAYAERLGAQ